MYNILWFEDEAYNLEEFYEDAETKGLKLENVPYRQKGIEALKLHKDKYDAIILDAEMPEKSIHETAGISGIKDVVKLANELHIPCFVSTGKDHLKDNEFFQQAYTYVFVKGYAMEEKGLGGDNELFVTMLEVLGQREKTQIKRLYDDVITALEALGIVDEGCEILLPILCKMHNPDDHPDFNPTHHYTQLRVLIEYLFRVFNKYGILPDAFIIDEGRSENGRKGVNLDLSCRYLQGEKASHIPYQSKTVIFPTQLGYNILSIIRYANICSHSAQLTEDEELMVKEELSKQVSRYTIYTFVMMLCEAILWIYEYIQKHPNYAANQAMWIETVPAKNNECKLKVGDVVQLSRDSKGNVYVENAKTNYRQFEQISDDELIYKKYKITNITDTYSKDRMKDKYPYFITVEEIKQ